MFRNRHNHWQILVSALLVMLVSWPAFAQTQPATPVVKPKAGQETCDGALDIVPSKAATFMRKRRVPGKKSAPKTELKSDNKSSF